MERFSWSWKLSEITFVSQILIYIFAHWLDVSQYKIIRLIISKGKYIESLVILRLRQLFFIIWNHMFIICIIHT